MSSRRQSSAEIDQLLTDGEKPSVLILTTVEFGEPYECVLSAKPAGFNYEGNFIVRVAPGSVAEKAGVKTASRVIRVNDTDINDANFKSIFDSADPPLRLTLEQQKHAPLNSSGLDGGTTEAITRSTMIGLLLVYVSVFLDWFSNLLTLPVLPFLAKKLGMQDSQLGFIVAIYQLAAIFGGLVTLKIAEWKGTKWGICYSICGTGLTLILVVAAWDFPSLMAFRAVAGLTGNSVPVAITHIGMVVPNHLKPQYFSYVGLCVTAAVMLAPAFGGSLTHYGIKLPFLVGGGMALMAFVFAAVMLPNLQIPKKSATDTGVFTLANKATMVLSFLKTLSYTATISMAANYLMRRFKLDGQDVGLIISVHGLIVCLNTAILYPRVNRRLGMYGTSIFGFLVMTIGFAFAGLMPTWLSFQVFISMVAGIGFGYELNSCPAITDRFATPSTRAKLHSLGGVLDNLGFAAGAAIWGIVMEYGFKIEQDGLVWWVASFSALLCFLTDLSLYLFVFKKAEASEAEAKKLAHSHENHHKYANWQDEIGTEQDYIEFGRRIGTYLSQSHYKWVTYMEVLEKRFKQFFPVLPVDSAENYFAAISKFQYNANLVEASYREDESGIWDSGRNLPSGAKI